GRRMAAGRDRIDALMPNFAPFAGHVSMAVVVGSAAVLAGTHVHSHAGHTKPAEVRAAVPASANGSTPVTVVAASTVTSGPAESARGDGLAAAHPAAP